jgi:hypothetical protein
VNRWRTAWLTLALVGCGRPPSAEVVADRAAASGQWQVAYQELQAAEPTPDVVGKRGVAALEADNLRGAAVAFLRLGQLDPARRGEAAAGLARTAARAGRRGDPLALTHAVLGLREIAPDWPVGRLALNLRLSPAAPPGEVVALVPAILAGSPSNETAEASILSYALARLGTAGCAAAVPLLDALAGRVEGASRVVVTEARAGCLVGEGLSHLAAGDTLAARRALDATVAMDPAGAAGRRALIALGDVYLSEGNPFAARVAWQTAAAATTGADTITALALGRLRSNSESAASGEPDRL